MSYRTAPDFNSAIDLEAKYHALLAAHEVRMAAALVVSVVLASATVLVLHSVER